MNINRRTALLASAAFASTTFVASRLSAQSAAGPGIKFTKVAFESAQAANKAIVIEVTAPWCPVCKVQKPILSSLKAKPAFSDVAIFEVDFDSEKETLKTFGVSKQSTLIAFKGKKETSRSVGETKPEAIETLLKSAI